MLSVSQTLRTRHNEITFSADGSRVRVLGSVDRKDISFDLKENDGLYELEVSPLHLDDPRLGNLPRVDMTLDNDPRLLDGKARSNNLVNRKAPTRLGVWHCKVLWIARKVGVQGIQHDYDDNLTVMHSAIRTLFRRRSRQQGGPTNLGRQAIWPNCRSVSWASVRIFSRKP